MKCGGNCCDKKPNCCDLEDTVEYYKAENDALASEKHDLEVMVGTLMYVLGVRSEYCNDDYY